MEEELRSAQGLAVGVMRGGAAQACSWRPVLRLWLNKDSREGQQTWQAVCAPCAFAAPPRASSNNSLACALSFGNTQGLWMRSVWRNEGSPFCMGPAQPASSWKRERDEPCCRCEGHLCPLHTLPSWTPGNLCASGQ